MFLTLVLFGWKFAVPLIECISCSARFVCRVVAHYFKMTSTFPQGKRDTLSMSQRVDTYCTQTICKTAHSVRMTLRALSHKLSVSQSAHGLVVQRLVLFWLHWHC
eukprot:1650235-Amphidinium_carterae.2